ncbi:hypothetical protein H2200_003527 [Cladophialophora chaetospira]|uniref:Uncharacterized protein n=1 Tax=Cladophialophora chaetospira TaxID=386627 RepID=A0AA38XHI8_9EURO|nr:hypothetical protein H2200_003527 [Cladophialophora chaetospira]
MAPDLLGMSFEMRNKVLRLLMGIEDNHSTTIQFDEADLKARRESFHCNFSGVNVLQTCKQLYNEGIRVLLDDNYFIAIIGWPDEYMDSTLTGFGVHAFWKVHPWIGKWNAESGFFDLRDRTFHPDITVLVQYPDNDEDPPMLVPARHLSVVVSALQSIMAQDGERSFEVTFGCRGGNIMLGPKQPVTLERLKNDMIMWIGGNVETVATTSKHSVTEEEASTASELGDAIATAVDSVHELRRSPDLQDDTCYTHLRGLVDEMERSAFAGNDEKAMQTYQALRDRSDLCVDRGFLQTREDWLDRLLAYAAYRIARFSDPASFGWELRHYRKWALQEARDAEDIFEESDTWFPYVSQLILELQVSLVTEHFDPNWEPVRWAMEDVAATLAPDEIIDQSEREK